MIFKKKALFFLFLLLPLFWAYPSYSKRVQDMDDQEYEDYLHKIYNAHYKDPTPHSEWQEQLNALGKKRHKLRPKDTMWDVTGEFFKKPPYWSKMWVANPEVENPHRIYEGDFLNFAKLASVNSLSHSVDVDKQFPGVTLEEKKFAKGGLRADDIPKSLPNLNSSFKPHKVNFEDANSYHLEVPAIVPSYISNFLPSSTGYIVKKEGYGKIISTPGDRMIIRVEAGVVGSGSIFTVFKSNGAVSGWLPLVNSKEILIKGRIKIISYITGSDKLYFAEAVDIIEKMEVDDLIYQGEPPTYVFTQRGSIGKAEGQIIGTGFKPQLFLAQDP